MQALTLSVAGRAYGGQAASFPTDFTRLGEMQSAFSGTAPLHHAHVVSDIADFSATVLGLIESNPSAVALALRPNGGLASGVDGFYVDSGIVSFRGHRHSTADLTDFSAGMALQLGNEIWDSDSVQWNRTSSGVQALVRRQPAGGLLSGASGMSVDFGPSHTQAAYGDHTHSQLHDPVTVEASSSLSISLAGQDLTMEVQLAAASGLKITPSGLAVDFGIGHGQVMRGDAGAAGGAALTAWSTSSLTLDYDPSANTLSGVVALDGSPSFGRGKLGLSSAGLYVQLGTDAQSASVGNHIHANASSGTNGFMSASDYQALHAILDFGGLSISTDVDEALNFHDSIFFDSGTGIFVNGQKVAGNRVPAPASLTISLGGTISDILAAIPNPATITYGDPSGVQKLVGDLTANILPAIRNALASIAAKDNQIITAGRNFGWMG